MPNTTNATERRPVKSYRLDRETHRQIDALAAYWQTSQSNAIARCVERIYQQEQTMNKQNKINVVLECLHALKRGVDRPTVVLEDDGSYSYIPGAYVADVSYTGSREVVFDVEEASFGPEFDVDAATDMELREAAEWAASEWDWTPGAA
jgi:hypothetical protein